MSRLRQINDLAVNPHGHCVIYLMSRDQRVQNNAALAAAQEHALSLKLPLLVLFHLYTTHGHRARQQLEFMLAGLTEVASELRAKSISFHIAVDMQTRELAMYTRSHFAPACWYLDVSPLRGARARHDILCNTVDTAVYEVDAHNIIPIRVLSDKEEFSAATIRPKIKKHLSHYLTLPPDLKVHPYRLTPSLLPVDWDRLSQKLKAPTLPDYKLLIQPGRAAALALLQTFVHTRYMSYSTDRNDPSLDGQSHLSAYLHFGILSPLEVTHVCLAQEKSRLTPTYNGVYDTRSPTVKMFENQFLEELIVRRELAENFCYYNPHYDSLAGARSWAQETLNAARHDPRAYVYTYSQLEHSETHDPAWNAAQRQLTQTGRMHGYMRMYWAKKILEWTSDPETAIAYAIKLNDTYELDGLDPNGYTGIMWSICGIHDRPWFKRPVIGTIRPMTLSGLEKKFHIDDYIRTWSSKGFF